MSLGVILRLSFDLLLFPNLDSSWGRIGIVTISTKDKLQKVNYMVIVYFSSEQVVVAKDTKVSPLVRLVYQYLHHNSTGSGSWQEVSSSVPKPLQNRQDLPTQKCVLHNS